MKDDFGDRMKLYEGAEAARTLMPMLPAMARLDGRAFHGFTSKMRRPYDERMTKLMIKTTDYLVRASNACCGYCQSDEISLCWFGEEFQQQIFFDGRIMKMTSILAGMTALYFYRHIPDFFGDESDYYQGQFPTFDCRVWNVPNLIEGSNVFLWREKDATKNSITMAAQAVYSHNELHGKSGAQKQEMLWQKGINWNDYPADFKRGTFIQRRKTKEKITLENLKDLPEKHNARLNPEIELERTEYRQVEMPPFVKVTNRPDVIFYGADPIVASE